MAAPKAEKKAANSLVQVLVASNISTVGGSVGGSSGTLVDGEGIGTDVVVGVEDGSSVGEGVEYEGNAEGVDEGNVDGSEEGKDEGNVEGNDEGSMDGMDEGFSVVLAVAPGGGFSG
eukprot:scaffold31831_cov168-Amphora_coffeaeformis.AAC.2